MPQNSPCRHHYIPEFYLKRWTDQKKQFVEFSKPWGDTVKPKRVSPKQTGFVDRLYELAGLSDEARQRMETEFFRPVDTRAATVLEALEKGRTAFTATERSAWSRFMTSLLFRTPENVAAIKEQMLVAMQTVDGQAERAYRKLRHRKDPRTFREYLTANEIHQAVDRAALGVLTMVADSRKLGSHIINMRWGSLTVPFNIPALLTSDRPVFILHGLTNANCEILMPLSPKSVFYAVNSETLAAQFGMIDANDLVAKINELVVRRAEKYVYGITDRELNFVQANMGRASERTPAERASNLRKSRKRRDRNAVAGRNAPA